MQEDMKFELRREMFHLVFGILTVLGLLMLGRNAMLWLLFSLIIAGVLFSLAILRYRPKFMKWLLKRFERPKFISTFPGKGLLFFMAGSLIVIKLFSPDIAAASITILTFGDSVSHLVGMSIKGRNIIHKKKNIEGTIAGAAAAFIASSIFVPIAYAAIASAGAMIAESITIRLGGDNVDDNLIVPVAAGAILYFLFRLF
jgi:dolichol kinase